LLPEDVPPELEPEGPPELLPVPELPVEPELLLEPVPPLEPELPLPELPELDEPVPPLELEVVPPELPPDAEPLDVEPLPDPEPDPSPVLPVLEPHEKTRPTAMAATIEEASVIVLAGDRVIVRMLRLNRPAAQEGGQGACAHGQRSPHTAPRPPFPGSGTHPYCNGGKMEASP
jgi:hypothetical protein